MYQFQYWKEMQELKVHAYYLEFYQIECENSERLISVFLAITSSASIGAWAIWKNAAMLWGGVIAASQVLSVVHQFLPFRARIKPLGVAAIELFLLSEEAEQGWYEVSEGLLKGKEVHDKRMELRRKKSAIMKAAFPGGTIPVKSKLLDKAEEKSASYFNNYYPVN
ncbi:hypothetical protein PSH87_18405 [Pseudomonas sp. FP453]|uniref:hypothetical protein n=1 Tax=Pseudomonas sp. FP453 TaxID=2954094 RepID=UPI0027372AED|nr:hypothetical protein [Pseudomonas sp. FP453]WLH88604.1 hypothetical protein PSH87_18405 [Pseudomonas sp. FP453]